MLNTYKKISKCRICNSKNIYEYLNLGMQPLANSFIKSKDIKFEKKFPLKMILCKNCGLSFLSVTINPQIIFNDYDYLSSSSKALINHYKKLTSNLCTTYQIKKDDLILDIGCNDGILLNQYTNKFKNLLGVEPSNASKLVNTKKIKLLNKFFNYNLSKEIKYNFGYPKLITITNVFAHIDDIKNFVKGLANISNHETVIVIEFPYLLEMINKNLYDLIYHEHLSYLSLQPLNYLFNLNKLKIFKFEKINMGASGPCLRIYISKKDSKYKISKKFINQLNYEIKWGIFNNKTYNLFRKKVENHKIKFLSLIKKLNNNKNSIGCFSAPAKGNTLLNYMKISNKIIKYVSENNKRKIGKLTPGTHYKIINDNDFLSKKISYSILLSWNYKKFFLENSKYSKKGNYFIVPMPNPHIIKKNEK